MDERIRGSGGTELSAPSTPVVAWTVGDLTRANLGEHVEVHGWMRGYVYGIRDDYHDGYPDRTLTLICEDDGCGYGHDRRFSDSDPSGDPKTMATAVHSLDVGACA